MKQFEILKFGFWRFFFIYRCQVVMNVFLMTVILNSIFAFDDENTNLLIFVITAGSGSGDSQHKKIKNLQKDLDYQREKVMELEKELKMVR